jgi:predicted F0F1-ATPase subunit
MDKQKLFTQNVGLQIMRKIKAERRKDHIWFEFAMFGLIGWPVALPVFWCFLKVL